MKKTTKKILSLFLSLVLVLTTVFAIGINTAFGATSGAAGEKITWSYDASTTTLTLSGTGATYTFRNMNLGSSYKKNPWADYKSAITKVVVGEGITELGQFAFYNCTALTTVQLPSTLTKIGGIIEYGCFRECTSLKEIALPSKLETIDKYAFQGCTALTNITIPNSVKNVENGAFYGCSGITSVTFGTNDIDLGQGAFYNCTKLKTINWGGLTKIPAYGFYGYFGSSLDLPETITSIGFRAFAENYNLRSVTINNADCEISTTGANITSGRSEVGSPFAGHQQEVTIHGHSGSTAQTFVDTYTTDSTQHYTFKSIDDCDHTETYEKVLVPATCTAVGTLQHICSNCGNVVKTEEIKALGHDYEQIDKLDNTTVDGHIYTTDRCKRENCGSLRDNITHATTGKTSPVYVWVDGYYDKTVTGGTTCKTPYVETYVCKVENCYASVGSISSSRQQTFEVVNGAMGSHKVEIWTIVKKESCTEDGERTGKCTVCGETVTETIDATGHIYSTEEGSADFVDSVSAEESGDGHSYVIYQCQNCTEQPIVPTHVEWLDYDGSYESRVISEAQCVIPGARIDTCNTCGETRTVVLPSRGGHELYETRTVAPTCSATGSIDYACKNCSYTTKETIPANSHDYYAVPENSVDPTCEKNGSTFLKCKNCSATSQTTIPKLGHIVDENNYTIIAVANCEEAGKGVSVCETCGETFEYEIPALGHDYIDSVVDLTSEKKPGHTLVTPVCTRCKTRQQSSMVHAEWIEGYYTTENKLNSTCNVQGYTTDTCTICNETRNNYKPVLGHNYNYVGDNEYTSDTLACVTKDGMLYRCSICQRTTRVKPSFILERWNKTPVNSKEIGRGVENENGGFSDWSSLVDANGDMIINGKDYALVKHCIKLYNKKLDEENARVYVNFVTDKYITKFDITDCVAKDSLLGVLPIDNLTMSDMDGYAKIAKLDKTIDVNEKDFETVYLIVAGDVYLTDKNELVVAYSGKITTTKCVKLGRLESTDNLAECLGDGDIVVSFNS